MSEQAATPTQPQWSKYIDVMNAIYKRRGGGDSTTPTPDTHDMETKKPIVFDPMYSTYTVPVNHTASYLFGLIRKVYELHRDVNRLRHDGSLLPVHGEPGQAPVIQNPQFQRVAALATSVVEVLSLGELNIPISEIHEGYFTLDEGGAAVFYFQRRFTVTSTAGRFLHDRVYCLRFVGE